jgi:hypothetical protein
MVMQIPGRSDGDLVETVSHFLPENDGRCVFAGSAVTEVRKKELPQLLLAHAVLFYMAEQWALQHPPSIVLLANLLNHSNVDRFLSVEITAVVMIVITLPANWRFQTSLVVDTHAG